MNPQSGTRSDRNRPARALCAVVLILGTATVGAQETDLSYPTPGASAPLVDRAKGESNTGAVLTPAEARERALLYRQGHLIIDSDFNLIQPTPPAPPAEKPAAEPKPAAATPPPPEAKDPRGDVAVSAHTQKGLLWKLERAGKPASYLFGTIHVEDPRVTRLPGKVKQAFDASRSFTMEALLDQPEQAPLAMGMLFSDGRDLETVAGRELYDQTARLLADYGIPARAANAMKPWAAMLTLSYPKPKTGLFLDKTLYLAAKEKGKAVHGLETLAEQIAVFDELPMDDQVTLLRETVANAKELPRMFEDMTKAYLARDLTRLTAIADEYQPKDARLAREFMQRLLKDRNGHMLERMLPRLEEGHAFVAVGALHLAGQDGLLAQLKNRGYRVSPIY